MTALINYLSMQLTPLNLWFTSSGWLCILLCNITVLLNCKSMWMSQLVSLARRLCPYSIYKFVVKRLSVMFLKSVMFLLSALTTCFGRVNDTSPNEEKLQWDMREPGSGISSHALVGPLTRVRRMPVSHSIVRREF